LTRLPPAHLKGVAVLEGDVGERPGRVVFEGQDRLCLSLANAHHVVAEQRRGAEVVGVVVGVDDVGHLVGHVIAVRDRVNGALQVVPDGRGRVEQHDPLTGGEERGHVSRVGDVIQVLLHLPDIVAVRVEGMTERGGRHRRVVGQSGGGGGRAAGVERAAVRE
jgi:hypothetical protein